MVTVMIILSIIAYNKGQPDKLVKMDDRAQDAANDAGTSWMQHQMAQLKKDSDALWLALVIIIVYGYMWMEMMRRYAKTLVYTSLAAGLMMLAIFGVECVTSQAKSIKTVGYIVFGVVVVLVVIIVLLRSRISLTCVMIEEAMTGVASYPSMLVVSAGASLLFVVFLIYWISSMVYLYSVPRGKTEDGGVKFDDHITQMQYLFIFGFFWVTTVLSGIVQVTVAGGMSCWYFTRNTNLPYHPVYRSLGNALTTSFGSICFGALILTVVKFINYLLTQAKKNVNGNPIAKFLIAVARCFCMCIEGLVKFINRFAYVYVAMYGDSFCASAKQVFNLMGRNGLMTVVLDTITQWVLFFGKIFGVALVCTITISYLQHHRDGYVAVSTMSIIALSAYILLSLLCNVIGVGVDAVFVCYMEDIERNGELSEMKASPDLQSTCVNRIEKHTANKL